ncbi:hypothetical protein MMC24_003634 [Lignoscripta atroalba]|nr:hypothetical protein [Lignoscripta atroalba]
MAADGSTKSVTRNDVTSHSTDDSGLSDDASIGTFSRASLFKTLTLELKDDRSFWKYQPTRQPDSGEFLKIKRSRSVPPAHRLHLDSTSLSPPICTELQSVASDYLSVSAAPSKSPRDSMIVQDRKHFLIYKPTTSMIAAMNRWVSEVHAALDPFRSEDECWLHPLPPPPRSNGRAYGTIRRKIQWTDYIGPHFVDVNYGIVALIVDSTLTDAQKEGYIKEAWHLSHLCGNWTCCNWRHFTVEPGAVNISRNTCFMYSKGCNHDPKCLKHLKQRLLPMVREIGNECPRRKSQGEVEGLHSEYIGNECSMDSDSGEDCAIKLRVLQEHEKPLYMAEDRLHDSPPEPDLPVALW